MTTVPDFVEAVRHQQRAARHTESLTLVVHGLAIAGLAVVNSRSGWTFTLVGSAVPGVVYLTLWLILRVRRHLTGIGAGRDGFGVLALAGALLVIPLLPVTGLAMMFVGAGTFLGIGLVAIGARLKSAPLWGAGAALVVVCPFVSLYTFDNHVRFLGPQPGTLVLSMLAAMLLALSWCSYRAERAELLEPHLA